MACEHNCSNCSNHCGVKPDDITVKLMRNRSEIEAVLIDSNGEVLRDRIPVEFMARQNKLDYCTNSPSQAPWTKYAPQPFHYLRHLLSSH